jgi:hypothetical protein
MHGSGGSEEEANDPAAVVNVGGHGHVGGVGRIDGGEDTLVQQESVVRASGVEVLSHDLAPVVDAEGLGPHGAREIDLREDAFVEQEPVG